MLKNMQGKQSRRKLAQKLHGRDLQGILRESPKIYTNLDFSFSDVADSLAVHRAFDDDLDIRSITWFIPGFQHVYYGGIYTILRFASYLKTMKGVESHFALITDESDEKIANMIFKAFPPLAGSLVKQVCTYDDIEKLPGTDASVATLWTTAYYLLRFNRTQRKFYFLQDYEALFYPAGTIHAQVEATYRFGFYGIANTSSIKEFYEDGYGGVAHNFFPCVDTEVFHLPEPTDKQSQGPYKVFFYGRPQHPRNGFELGAEALKHLKARLGNDVHIVSAGDEWDPVDFGLQGIVENLGLLSYEQTAELYRTCDAALVLMFTRHPSYLPFELMASGCLVVTNYNPATTWLLADSENCLLTVRSVTCIADALQRALEDQKIRDAITFNASKEIRESYSDWDQEIERIYQFMCAQPKKLTEGLTMYALRARDKESFDINQVTFGGERVSHLYPNDCYYAHLSIYNFALPFAKDGLVLDAGAGTGYGSAYLAEHGAKFVYGVDISELAISFDQAYFQRPNLHYRVMSLENLTDFPSKSFDLIFSSNVLEHVPNVVPFFRSAWDLLKPDGTVIIVVPPVTDENYRNANIENPYHLNIWSPEQWYHVLSQYFSEIQAYRHDGKRSDVMLDFGNKPEETVVDETDFIFEPISLEAYYEVHSLGVVFVAKNPRDQSELPALGAPLTFVDDSFTRPPQVEPVAQIPMVHTSSSIFGEVRRLLGRVKTVVQEQGGRGLVAESLMYINWRFNQLGDRRMWVIVGLSILGGMLISKSVAILRNLFGSHAEKWKD
jgi:O-antigen biosynthesis protein